MTQDHRAPLAGRALILARDAIRRGAMTRRRLKWLALLGFALGLAFGPRLLALLQ